MPTLNKLVSEVAHELNRPYDYILHSRIRELLIAQRSELVHREIDKYGINEIYIQGYQIDEFELVNASEIVGINSSKQLLRSVNKIPTPIRYQTDDPFLFMGSADHRITFRYVKPFMTDFISNLRYIGNGITYSYVYGYIYILNNIKIKKALVEAPYNSLDIVNEESDLGICYLDDMEFPIAGDLVRALIISVVEILKNGKDFNNDVVATVKDIN